MLSPFSMPFCIYRHEKSTDQVSPPSSAMRSSYICRVVVIEIAMPSSSRTGNAMRCTAGLHCVPLHARNRVMCRPNRAKHNLLHIVANCTSRNRRLVVLIKRFKTLRTAGDFLVLHKVVSNQKLIRACTARHRTAKRNKPKRREITLRAGRDCIILRRARRKRTGEYIPKPVLNRLSNRLRCRTQS